MFKVEIHTSLELKRQV